MNDNVIKGLYYLNILLLVIDAVFPAVALWQNFSRNPGVNVTQLLMLALLPALYLLLIAFLYYFKRNQTNAFITTGFIVSIVCIAIVAISMFAGMFMGAAAMIFLPFSMVTGLGIYIISPVCLFIGLFIKPKKTV